MKKKLAHGLSEIGIAYSRSPLIQKNPAVFRHQHDLAPGCRARPSRSYPERVTTLFVVRPSSSRPHAAGVPRFPCLANTMEAIGATLTEAGGALRTLFIQARLLEAKWRVLKRCLTLRDELTRATGSTTSELVFNTNGPVCCCTWRDRRAGSAPKLLRRSLVRH